MKLATLTSHLATGALLALLAVTLAGCNCDEEGTPAPDKEQPAKTAPKDHPAH